MEKGRGYWLRLSESEEVQFVGAKMDELELDVVKGWNIIAGPSSIVPVASIQDPESIVLSQSIFGFNGTYVPAANLDPGNGYWIRVSDTGRIVLSPYAQAKPVVTPSTQMEGFIQVKLQSGDQAQLNLYINPTQVDPELLERYVLPPIPPRGVFDARFPGDAYATSGDEVEIRIQHGEDPTTIMVEADPDLDVRLIMTMWSRGNLRSTHIVTPGIHHSVPADVERILLQDTALLDAELPQTFELQQNFPNPFNPSTVIRYALPAAEEVSLEVFSVLGQRVAVLADGPMQAGWHEARFDGSGLASGVYVYRLTSASGFTQTRRLMLVK